MNVPHSEPSAVLPAARREMFRRPWLFAVTALCLIFLLMRFRAELPRAVPGINDFMGIYAGARLVGTPEQFSADAYIREQIRATGWSAPSVLYTRLPAFAVLLRPLGRLKYKTAFYLWEILSLAAFGAFLILWPTRDRVLLVCAACSSFALFADVTGGQDIAFLLLILAVAWRLGPTRPYLAGAVLGLAVLKFHLLLLIPVFLIAQRRWHMLAGAATTIAATLAICFAAAGMDWMPKYVHFVLQGQTNPNVRAMVNLHGLVDGLPHSPEWELAGAVLVAIGVGWIARRSGFSAGLSVALVGSMLTSHHAYAADLLLLLPALLTLAAEAPSLPPRVLCFLLLTPLPFLIGSPFPLASPIPILLVVLMIALTVSVAAAPRPGSVAQSRAEASA